MRRSAIRYMAAALAMMWGVSEARAQASDQGRKTEFINTWLIAGPFANERHAGMSQDFVGGEDSVKPVLNAPAGERKWTYFDDRLFSRNYDDYQDLFSLFVVKARLPAAPYLAYANVYVWSQSQREAVLRTGGDTHTIAWLNGKRVIDSVNVSGARESAKASVVLNEGWNQLLMKVGNEKLGRLGFYARFSTPDGKHVEGLEYSVDAPGKPLHIVQPMAIDQGEGDRLPGAFRAWPYVGAQVDFNDPVFSLTRQDGALHRFGRDAGWVLRASDYRLMAGGGVAPYQWNLGDGSLPPGLSITPDGRIVGTIADTAPLGIYRFRIWVADAERNLASRAFTIDLRERPNRWYEQARLGALIHRPETLKAESTDEFMQLMKRRGYGLAMPISWNNGDYFFRWPSAFSGAPVTDDVTGRFAASARKAGMRFGMYMGNLTASTKWFGVDEQNLVLLEAIQRYQPAALWFDWAGFEESSLDALYSLIKSASPETLVILNGHVKGTQGDWDVASFEAWDAWGPANSKRFYDIWPEPIPWPKRHSPETWRLATDGEFEDGGPDATAWDDFLRVQLSLIGEGYIANMDFTPYLGPQGGLGPQGVKVGTDTYLIKLHKQMADWANPPGKPSMVDAYTNVDPGPLETAPWGYNTISTSGDTIYLIIMKNHRGKTGLPDEPTLTVSPLSAKVKSVTCMNTNEPLSFEQRGTSTDKTVTINLNGVKQDMVATIIRISLVAAIAHAPVMADDVTKKPAAETNVALNKPARLLSADGRRELGQSANQVARWAVDGDLSTTGAAGGEYAWSFWLDLEKMTGVKRVVVNFRKDGWATKFDLLSSINGDEWSLLETREGTGPGPYEFKMADPVPARYLRVRAIKPDGENQPGGQMSIAELEAYEGTLPADAKAPPITEVTKTADSIAAVTGNIAIRRPAKLLSADGERALPPCIDYAAERGVDGDENSWAQAGGEIAWAYEIDLGKPQTIARAKVGFRPNGFATEFKFLSSVDGKIWTDLATKTNDGAGPVEMKFAATEARYVRLRAVKPDAGGQPGDQMGITELQVFAADK